MNNRIDEFRSRTDGVVIPKIGVALALSILMHIAALWELPPITVQLPGTGEVPDQRAPLTARLAPLAQPSPPVSAPPQPAPEPARRVQRPKAVPRPQAPPAPPVIALNKPVPGAPSVTVPKPAPAAVGDMASYIEAQRRARGAPETPPAAESDDARTKRLVAGNLATPRESAFGYDPRQGGGVFQIERLSDNYAEFYFHGWNKDARRNTKQLIEVRRGNNSDIRIAVVRRMIAIIRDHEQEDFLWQSRRLERSITLSARARDNAGLEAFMVQEFFFSGSPAQR